MYDPTVRAEAIRLYIEHGTAEASRLTDIPKRTIRHWANQDGVAAARDDTLTEGGERLALTHTLMRTEARLLMVEKVVDLLERIDAPHKEYKVAGNSIHEVEHEIATSGDVRNYVSSVKALIESYRLEMGESTDRTEHVTLEQVQERIRHLRAVRDTEAS